MGGGRGGREWPIAIWESGPKGPDSGNSIFHLGGGRILGGMETAVGVFTVLLPVLYALTALQSVWVFVEGGEKGSTVGRWLLRGTVAVHLAALATTAAWFGRCPLASVREALGLTAFSLAAVYLVLETRGGSRPTGILILPLAFLLELMAALIRKAPDSVNPALQDPWFSIHAAAAVLGIAALAISFVHGVFYLLLYRQIRTHRHGLLFRRLPPLTVLNRMALLSAVIGWGLLLVTIVAGYIWGAQAGKLAEMHRDPLFMVTIGCWLVYTVGLAIRYLGGWRGRYAVYLSVCGFAAFLLSLVAVTFLFPSMH